MNKTSNNLHVRIEKARLHFEDTNEDYREDNEEGLWLYIQCKEGDYFERDLIPNIKLSKIVVTYEYWYWPDIDEIVFMNIIKCK